MSKDQKIEALEQRVQNLTRMNEILRRLVVSLSRSGKAEKEEEFKPRLH